MAHYDPRFDAPTYPSNSIPQVIIPQIGQSERNGPPQQNGLGSTTANVPFRRKLLDVDQALQFSPFSSVLPFSPEPFPLPSGDTSDSRTSFVNLTSKVLAQKHFDSWNREFELGGAESNIRRQIENQAQDALDPAQISDFQFRAPSTFYKPKNRHSKANGNVKPAASKNLSPLSEALFQRLNLNYTVNSQQQESAAISTPLPTSNKVQTTSRAHSDQHEQSETQLTEAKVLTNGTLEHDLSRINVIDASDDRPRFDHKCNNDSDATLRVEKSSVSDQSNKVIRQGISPAIVIPAPTAESRQADFVTLGDPSKRTKPKQKQRFGLDQDIQVSEGRDQKAVADEAVRVLKETVHDILEADDQSQPHPQFLILISVADQEMLGLTSTAHYKIDAGLQRLISYGRLYDFAEDDLARMQQLCQRTLTLAESHDIAIDLAWSSDESSAWANGIEIWNNALLASQTILRTMKSGRQGSSLKSEELLQNVLQLAQKLAETCLIPLVELRPHSSPNQDFSVLSSQAKQLAHLTSALARVLRLFMEIVANEEITETFMAALEFLSIRLIFIENASTEKDSIIGIQRYETLRRAAMDLVTTIFSRHPNQRAFLFDEILTSFQKLPTGSKAARQYKLSDGGSIQLVTALIVQLVQSSAILASPFHKARLKSDKDPKTEEDECMADASNSDNDNELRSEDDGDSDSSSPLSKRPEKKSVRKVRRLADKLFGDAAKSAQHAVAYLLNRAQTSSKSGDQPHRQLLDIFVEDLLIVFSDPQWPGAELLLRALSAHAGHLIENPKSSAPAKNMALELLGMMGSAISDLVSSTRSLSKSLDKDGAGSARRLRHLVDEYSDTSLDSNDLIQWEGPFHAVVEFFEQSPSNDLFTISAQTFFLAQWSKLVAHAAPNALSTNGPLSENLYTMMTGEGWPLSDTLSNLDIMQCRIAYSIAILHLDFCRRFDYMLKILLDSVTSEQTTVRSRGLKSVTQMLDRDPSILDRVKSVKALIVTCATDQSPMVRDAALTLMGRCISLKSDVEADFRNHILRLSNDSAVGVRKRSMKLLKDIYLRSDSEEVKAAVGDYLFRRLKDADNGVIELAQQTFEEIWLMPYWNTNNTAEDFDIKTRRQIAVVAGTSTRSPEMPDILVLLLKDALKEKSKFSTFNNEVCQRLVVASFDMIIDSNSDSSHLDQGQIVDTLTVFAKASPALFKSSQLQLLQPYIENVNGKNDLKIFRPAVVIFRYVLPTLSEVERGLLEQTQAALLKSVSRIFQAELEEVAKCLWTISCLLKASEPLAKVVLSALKQLHTYERQEFKDPNQKENLTRAKKYMQIIGHFGKHCNLEQWHGVFVKQLPWASADTTAGFLVASLHPFIRDPLPLALRGVALDAMGHICESWPYQFTKPSVSKVFGGILRNGERRLQDIALSHFRDFFQSAEHQASKNNTSHSTDSSAKSKLGSSMTASERDGASSLITQHFLKYIVDIALASQDSCAMTAAEVIAAVNDQGLAHPKDSGPALVALGTSSNPAIAQIAHKTHGTLHQQRESMLEREYMRAIQEAFRYQKTVAQDTHGYSSQPLSAKFHGLWEIIKTSNFKYQKKFLSNYCSRIDFDLPTMDISGDIPEALQFSRFLLENLAFFDFSRLDVLHHALGCLERLVSGTGSSTAHSISTEVFNVTVKSEDANGEQSKPLSFGDYAQSGNMSLDAPPAYDPTNGAGTVATADASRFRRLTTAALILLCAWDVRTHLRRLYGQNANLQRKDAGGSNKTKNAAGQDLSKAPTRVQGVSGEKLLSAMATRTSCFSIGEAAMRKQCEEFIELISVDSEVKVESNDDKDGVLGSGSRPQTPDGESGEERGTPASRTGGLKRKGSNSASSTPAKKRGRPPLHHRPSSAKKSVDAEGSDEEWK